VAYAFKAVSQASRTGTASSLEPVPGAAAKGIIPDFLFLASILNNGVFLVYALFCFGIGFGTESTEHLLGLVRG
jgi:hypothetical protein